jgi:hypothetical protein
MLRRMILVPAVLSLSLSFLGGCLIRGQVGGGAYVEADQPDLVYVSPGVYVVSDYDEPVFYDEGFYWLNRDGIWYRSRVHTGGWAQVSYVPVGVRHIQRPRAYVHYRANGRVYRRGRGGVVQVRDHRTAPARRVDVRDHRTQPARQVDVHDHRSQPARQVDVHDHRREKKKVEVHDHRR